MVYFFDKNIFLNRFLLFSLKIVLNYQSIWGIKSLIVFVQNEMVHDRIFKKKILFIMIFFCIRPLLLSDTIGLYLKEAVVCGCVCGWVCGWLVCNGVSLSGPWNSMSSMSFSCTCGWVRDLKFCIRIPSLNTNLRAWFHHDPNTPNTPKIP